ncbi:helix-turn-helix domain-containing protein [Bacillus sp. MRMR6]|uniref:helix-turn-helix domain-containing protein n=1 Tax=Bacillus sp. MRMR6 TaxID=1928617 RepID=UPI000951D21A|nr:helix-turn-helix domain-containing protein [Bacillus sp. MRMR6]OLS40942.1 DNA-binding protein [Bacillus sp. MRMR6]
MKINNELGLLLNKLLKEHSLTLRKFSELTGIDKATLSRITNGKRRATPEHLEKMANCLHISINDLYIAAGYPIEQTNGQKISDLHSSIDSLQEVLTTSGVDHHTFSIDRIEDQLEEMKEYSQTTEGEKKITQNFESKIIKIGSVGPFISELKGLYERFREKKGTPAEIAIIGSVLIYFIISVDVIPDYIFPIGYLDDAISVKLALSLLIKKPWE